MKLLKNIGNGFRLSASSDILVINQCYDVGLVIVNISNRLTEHLKLFEMGLKSKNLNLSIIINQNEIGKFKIEDKETNLERLIFICEQFESNGLLLNFNIYSYEKPLPYLTHEYSNSFWQFKKKWIGDKNQIMIKRSSDIGYNNYSMASRNIDLNFAYQYAKEQQLNVIEFDYTDKFENLLHNMIHSKFVISERSGLTVLATFSNVPVYLVTEEKLTFTIDGEERFISWGNGNLSLSDRIDHIIDGKIEQKYFNGFLKNITPKDTL